MRFGLVPMCIDCGVFFGDGDESKFCLACGGSRAKGEVFEELFEMIMFSRVTMRQADLAKFHIKIEDLLKGLVHGKKSSARNLMEIKLAYCETLAHQIDRGCKYTQGITRESFHFFLHLVAESLNLTCRSLLHGLLGPERLLSKGVDRSSMHEEIQRSTLRGPDTCAESCANCGCLFITNANFCCNCGHKQLQRKKKDPESFLIFEGTRASLLGLRTAEEIMEEKGFAELVALSQKHHVPLDLVRKYWKEFQEFDLSKYKLLQKDEFAEAVRERCNIPKSKDLPKYLIDYQWFKVAKDNGEFVDFEGFLVWSFGTECVEERSVPDPQERYLRALARKYCVRPNQVDDIKKIFDRFDVDGRGILDENSFSQTILHLVHARQAVDISHQPTMKRLWMEVSSGAESCITFDTFLGWYLRTWAGTQDNDRV